MTINEFFERFADSILKVSEVEHKLIDGDVFKVYETSELTLLSADGLKRNPANDVGISFELFGERVIFTKDGVLSATLEDDDGMEVYTLSDPLLRKTALAFLRWRLGVLEQQGF